MARTKIDLIYIDAGGGHRAAATALDAVIREQQRPWETRLRNIQDLLDPMDIIRKLTGIPFQDVYNIMLRRGWTLGTRATDSRDAPGSSACFTAPQVRVLRQHWSACPPGHGGLADPALQPRHQAGPGPRVCPGTPLVTILTDIADYPPHFWIERQDQYVICGSEPRRGAGARALGFPKARMMRSLRHDLNPQFYEPLEIDRAAERAGSASTPICPPAMMLFGGEGSPGWSRSPRR